MFTFWPIKYSQVFYYLANVMISYAIVISVLLIHIIQTALHRAAVGVCVQVRSYLCACVCVCTVTY